MEIFKTTICSFDERVKTDFGYRYIMNTDKYNKILCIKDGDMLIDINTNKEYYLLKKDKSGYILKQEFNSIELDVQYALDVVELKPEEKNIIMYMKAVNAKKARKKEQKILKR